MISVLGQNQIPIFSLTITPSLQEKQHSICGEYINRKLQTKLVCLNMKEILRKAFDIIENL